MPDTPTPTYRRSIRVFTILSRVFIPVGIVLLSIGVIMLAVGTPLHINSIISLKDSSECVTIGTSTRCSGPVTDVFVGTLILTIFGFFSFLNGLPLLIVGCVFRKSARKRRKFDEDRGIDYTDFPYGK